MHSELAPPPERGLVRRCLGTLRLWLELDKAHRTNRADRCSMPSSPARREDAALVRDGAAGYCTAS
jgi:hypothetical protein